MYIIRGTAHKEIRVDYLNSNANHTSHIKGSESGGVERSTQVRNAMPGSGNVWVLYYTHQSHIGSGEVGEA
jgi:hypothetical protein